MFKKILDKINEKLSFLNLRQEEDVVEEQPEENVEEKSVEQSEENVEEEKTEEEQSEEEQSAEKDKLDLVLNKDEIEYMSDVQRYEDDGGKCHD